MNISRRLSLGEPFLWLVQKSGEKGAQRELML
jgi:hypothetical protein